jgi:iron complex transport system permease protein
VKSQNRITISSLLALSIISLFIAVSIGSVHISEQAIYHAMIKNGPKINQTIIWRLRLPRAINAYITGGLLALTGVILQALLRNPLADPYILGVSGGSAVFALFGMMFGVAGLSINTLAFVGGLIAIVVVLSFSQKRFQWRTNTLLLTGVLFAAGCNAIISLILILSPDSTLKGMMFWLLGNFTATPVSKLGLGVLIFSLFCAFALAKPLDLLLNHGELKSKSLGVNIQKLLLVLYLLTALMTSTAVSIAGTIGFIGLMTPHLLRMLGCYQHRYLIPASVLLGGSLLCLADALSRTIVAPTQLPVGIITAFIGVPLFIILLRKRI